MSGNTGGLPLSIPGLPLGKKHATDYSISLLLKKLRLLTKLCHMSATVANRLAQFYVLPSVPLLHPGLPPVPLLDGR